MCIHLWLGELKGWTCLYIDSENSEDYLNINWQMRIPKISLKIEWQWQFIENSEDLIRFFVTLSLSYQFYIHLLISIPNLQWYVFIWGWDGILKEWNSKVCQNLTGSDRCQNDRFDSLRWFCHILLHCHSKMAAGKWLVIIN